MDPRSDGASLRRATTQYETPPPLGALVVGGDVLAGDVLAGDVLAGDVPAGLVLVLDEPQAANPAITATPRLRPTTVLRTFLSGIRILFSIAGSGHPFPPTHTSAMAERIADQTRKRKDRDG